MAGTGASARMTATRILARWLSAGVFPDHELEHVGEERALVHALTLGVVRQRRLLRYCCRDRLVSLPAPAVEAALLTGLYQLFFMRVPDYAAVSTAVDAARSLAGSGAARLVNAVLRGVLRNRAAVIRAVREAPWTVQLSHPDLIANRWANRFGVDAACALCNWNNRRAAIVARQRPGASVDLPYHWQKAGYTLRERRLFGETYLWLTHATTALALPPGWQRHVCIQDPATGLAVAALDPQPGDKVLDACASPGGKTLHLADRMQGKGILVATEIDNQRIALLRENLAHGGWSHFVRVRRADAGRGDKVLDGVLFDRILLDVPCSNTGVIRRRPDVRWRFSEERLARIVTMQERLLNAAARRVRPGGRIVYSTCSLEAEENRERVAAWLAVHPDFQQTHTRLLFPPTTGTDGAFVAVLEKRNTA